MGKHSWYECVWSIKHIRDGKIIYQEEKKNILVDEGEKLIGEVVFRDKASTFIPTDTFYIGLYRGSISESTVLATVPNEPSGNGYERLPVERSAVGWPTMEQHEGDWRWVSKEVSLTASGGDIGPVNGAFLGTSLDNTGSLIGAVAMKVNRTCIAGDSFAFQLRAKLK